MNTKKFNILLTIFLIVAISVSGVQAYLSTHVQKTNMFTVGKVDLKVIEQTWDALASPMTQENGELLTEDDGTPIKAIYNVRGNAIIEKDPAISNTGKNSAYVYLCISVPKAHVAWRENEVIQNADRSQNVQLFNFTPNSNWTLFASDTSDNDVNKYYYAYNTALTSGKTTQTLFDYVIFVNAEDGELDNQQLEIIINGYGIQTNMNGSSKGNMEMWNEYVAQNDSLSEMPIAE